MSMKWVGFPNHHLQHIASEKLRVRDSPTTATVTVTCDCETQHVSGWGCIVMATSHSTR
jgi:hypothetical protein